MSSESPRPHEALEGQKLSDGWSVMRRIRRSKSSTGGHFSCGYLVENADGRKGYLKALDFFSMLPESADPARDLEPLIKAFNFERDLLKKCGEGRLSKIVTALESGSITLSSFPPPATVQYIIFELADSDLRGIMVSTEHFDVGLALRTLHQIAVGLRQLHGIGVAHQDLKPSNVLYFKEVNSSKLGDLGRAAQRGAEPPHYALNPAGDYGYAPPETLYGGPVSSWETRRIGCDAYHLGSMIASVFTTVGMTPLTMMGLQPSLHWKSWSGPYDDALIFLRPAFDEAVTYVAAEIPEAIRADLVVILRQLCDPDPTKRGHPLDVGKPGQSFGLERYVSKLNALASRAEYELRRNAV